MDKFLGKRLDGRYEIQEIIGIGGMSVVYKAYDNVEDKIVSVKILKEEFGENSEFLRRFKNESKAVSVLNHPNIVKIHDVSFGDNFQYIVMEYIDGITLKEYIARKGVLSWKEAVFFSVQILHALQHAHDKGIVHRDIKPQNMLMLRDGTIKVTDFGIARFSRSGERTITDKAIGSVHYISPEQARGDVIDEKADLYSIGVLMYEMLTGSVPFDADSAVSVAIMQMQNDAKPPRQLNPDIPVGLEQIIMRAMRKNPNKRYLSDAEMLRDLEEFKRNPDVVFNYDNFDAAPSVDSSPTRYIDTPVVKPGSAAEKINELYGKKSATDEFDNIANPNDYEYDEPKKRSSLIPVLLSIAVAVFVIVVGFGAFLLINYFGGGGSQDTTCPQLVGMNIDEAKEQYKDEISIVVKDWEYNDEYALNEIIEQQYDPGKSLKKGSQVNVIVSSGKRKIEMPDIYNKTSDEAKQMLKDSGINNNISIINEYNSEIEKNKVIKTLPERGQLIDSDTVIEIYVSAGKPTRYVTVPNNLLGRNKTDVVKELEKADLTIGKIIERDDAAADGTVTPAGIVIGMSHKSGDSVGEFTAIDLIVSSGKKPQIYTFTYTVPKPADYVATSYKFVARMTTASESNEQTQLYTNDATEFSFTFESVYKDATVEVTLNDNRFLTVYFKDGKFDSFQEYSLGGISPPAGQ